MTVCLVFDIDDTIYVHNEQLDYDKITPDIRLQTLLQTIPYPKYVLTNATYGHANEIINRLEIYEHFKKVYSRDNIPAMKPEPHCYYAVFEDIQKSYIDVPDIIFFDDLLNNLASAKERGWITVWISPDHQDEVNYSFVDRAFPTLSDALENLNF